MKRRASDNDIGKALDRSERDDADALSMCIPTWKPPSPTPALSSQAPPSTDQQRLQRASTHISTHTSSDTFPYLSQQSLVFIRRWLDSIGPDYVLHTMAPTPRSVSASERRSSIRYRPAADANAPKTISPHEYRTVNLERSSIFVDDEFELPPEIDEYARRILGITSWEDQLPVPDGLGLQPSFPNIAKEFLNQSKALARKCALESQWQHSLYQVVTTLAKPFEGVIETNNSEKGKLSAQTEERDRVES